MFKYTTKVNKANPNSKTKRTTIPKEIIQMLDMDVGDVLEWNVEVINENEFKIYVTKKE